jgi:hypothetical protein
MLTDNINIHCFMILSQKVKILFFILFQKLSLNNCQSSTGSFIYLQE